MAVFSWHGPVYIVPNDGHHMTYHAECACVAQSYMFISNSMIDNCHAGLSSTVENIYIDIYHSNMTDIDITINGHHIAVQKTVNVTALKSKPLLPIFTALHIHL